MNLTQAVLHGQSLGIERLEAQMLVLHALQRPTSDRAWLLAHGSDELSAQTQDRVHTLAQRRASGEPMAYITGHKEFYGLDLRVDARVLDPRADTETLVDWALEVMDAGRPAGAEMPSAIDLGTGSGAIALALKHHRPQWQIHALDFSMDALAVAEGNAARLQLAVHFHKGSWLQNVQERFSLIVSNPPYIAAQDAHLAALTHEPLQALVSGEDGLDAIRTIVAQSPTRLLPGGWLLLEHGYDQAPAVRTLLQNAGFHNVQSRRDLPGIERCSGGQWQA
ncbi:peptide chain release factor N(5)-glutamine methyltransferase [Rhodoferax sp. GW822-FHT02A01]|uniref:peptide chain release factor N(5)-glutamine methyltransferase n=1 Tax=Rhodoferax sp. GW822-FHT02A01 TaxID=3141537 RepID=UPI00315DA4A7